MAEFSIIFYHQLDCGLILAPERYDPRRKSDAMSGILLNSLVQFANDQVQPIGKTSTLCVVFDTGDAREGVIRRKVEMVGLDAIGSAKKVVRPGDVIISRLRPYLRQVAFVDEIHPSKHDDKEVILLCSTEFFVLRSRDNQSISFLVPYLLSEPVQRMLAVSQEGGHHPRFNQDVLKELMIPASVVGRRAKTSEQIIEAVLHVRRSENLISAAVEEAKAAFASGDPVLN